MSTSIDFTAFKGGTDLMSPYLGVAPGRVIESLNFRVLEKGGYQKIKGYHLFDGHNDDDDALTIPGATGDVLGVWVYEGNAYAVATVGGADVLFKQSLAGWTAVAMPTVLYYDGGSVQFQDGDMITGGTSGATATVVRAVLGSGTLAGNTAAGVLVLTSVVGVFVDNEVLNVAATPYALANGTTSTYAMPSGGKYRFVNHNFFGQAATKRMYGVSGVGPAFEWDGTTFVPIVQGPAAYHPSFIAVWKEHLMLGYSGGSIVASATGDPMDYSALNGAFEVTTGDNITNMATIKGELLMAVCKESIRLYYGNDVDDINKKVLSPNRGAYLDTLQIVNDNIVMLDGTGVQNTLATQAFGDYFPNPVSDDIKIALEGAILSQFQPVSQYSQSLSEYRLFFGSNIFLFTFNGNEFVGSMLAGYDHDVRCACTGLDSLGREVMFFGSTEGRVFKQEYTNFFNGEPMNWLIRLPYAYESSPTRRKRYDKVVIDGKIDGEETLINAYAAYDFDQSDATRVLSILFQGTVGGKWNQVKWNEFKWAAPSYAFPNVPIRGFGLNMALTLTGTGEEDSVVSLYGSVLHYKMRKLKRANV